MWNSQKIILEHCPKCSMQAPFVLTEATFIQMYCWLPVLTVAKVANVVVNNAGHLSFNASIGHHAYIIPWILYHIISSILLWFTWIIMVLSLNIVTMFHRLQYKGQHPLVMSLWTCWLRFCHWFQVPGSSSRLPVKRQETGHLVFQGLSNMSREKTKQLNKTLHSHTIMS